MKTYRDPLHAVRLPLSSAVVVGLAIGAVLFFLVGRL
jgi:hypothetical protein